jgi:hypothetical protein
MKQHLRAPTNTNTTTNDVSAETPSHANTKAAYPESTSQVSAETLHHSREHLASFCGNTSPETRNTNPESLQLNRASEGKAAQPRSRTHPRC